MHDESEAEMGEDDGEEERHSMGTVSRRKLSRSRALHLVCLFKVTWQGIAAVTALRPFFSSQPRYDHDLVVIGAGASGLFAAGTASSLGCKTLLIDHHPDSMVGGDCTNAACVPSKAVRSVARMASNRRRVPGESGSWFRVAQRHANSTVQAVRQREDPTLISERNPNLDLLFVESCRFVSPHELEVAPRRNSTSAIPKIIVKSKKFLIATGASPIVPERLENEAKVAKVPVFTYRTLLQPPTNSTAENLWDLLEDSSEQAGQPKHLVIAGGGPTACELGQTLARLNVECDNMIVTIVAPESLPDEDVTLRRAAMKLLHRDGIRLILNRRVAHVEQDDDTSKTCVRLDDGSSLPVDALLLCLGRSPESSLRGLNLAQANVAWNPEFGVLVQNNTLRSKTTSHVFACGDCCSAVIHSRQRRAAHAGWTGFHAARNIVVPAWLRVGSRAVHSTVPSVIYTDPELASVGLSYTECVQKYGKDGFDFLYVPEEGMDRADMERLERPTIGFVELRATRVHGVVLGMTACGPAAAELANEIGLAICSELSTRDLARVIHSYPSHGYLLYRIALAMATGNTLGLLAAMGPIGKTTAACGRLMRRISSLPLKKALPWTRRMELEEREWEAEGSSRSIPLKHLIGDSSEPTSYLEIYQNETLRNIAASTSTDLSALKHRGEDLSEWLYRGKAYATIPERD